MAKTMHTPTRVVINVISDFDEITSRRDIYCDIYVGDLLTHRRIKSDDVGSFLFGVFCMDDLRPNVSIKIDTWKMGLTRMEVKNLFQTLMNSIWEYEES